MSNAVNAAVAAAIAKAAEQTNQGEAVGGGDYVPPKAGLSVVTLVGYVEIGIHQHDIPNKPSWDSNDVQLIFELNGGANKAEEVDGKLIAKRITVTEKLSSNEKANFFKIFNQLNYDGTATHMAQLVGKHYLAMVYNDKSSDGKKVFASLKGPNGYSFQAPVVFKGDPLDPENQTKVPVPAPKVSSEPRVFLWDYACKEMWDALYIDGSYEAKDGKPAKSKNVIQDKIRSAKNFATSPIKAILGEEALDLAESPLADTSDLTAEVQVADKSETVGEAAADPLDGLL